MPDKITFFESYYQAAMLLPDEERGRFVMSVLEYAFDGVEPDLDGAAALGFVLIKPNIDSSIKKASAGREGGSASKQKSSSQSKQKNTSQSKPKSTQTSKLKSTSAIDKDMDRDKDWDMEEEQGWEDSRFIGNKSSSLPLATHGAAAEVTAPRVAHCPVCDSEIKRFDGEPMWVECPVCGTVKREAIAWR